MTYQVLNKRTNELKVLTHDKVNDMDYDENGRVLIYGNDGEVYYLLVDKTMIHD